MYFDRQTRDIQARLRPFQRWFDTLIGKAVVLAILIVLFFVVQRWVG